MKFKNRIKRAATGLLALTMAVTTLLGSTGLTAYAADTEPNPQPPANGERIWSVDPFDAEYSAGYFCIKDSVGHNCTGSGNWRYGEDDCSGSNTERDPSVYIDHHSGACFNGKYFDIREYVWAPNNEYWCIAQNGANACHGEADARIVREFHFYKEGTLDSANPVEVSWTGVMRFTDIDIEEGYTFDQGLIDVWLNNPTNVTKRDAKTWKGTWENGNTGIERTHEYLWAEVEGTPSKPLIITYWGNATHGSNINYYGSSINYELVPDGKDPLPEGAKPAVGVHCATFAEYNLMPEDEFAHYAFDGWYYDKTLTRKAPSTIMVNTDYTFYGTYHKVEGLITTEVVNGTITKSGEYVPYGTDKTIEYLSIRLGNHPFNLRLPV